MTTGNNYGHFKSIFLFLDVILIPTFSVKSYLEML